MNDLLRDKMTNEEIINLSQKYLMNTYARFPVAFVRGEGCYLWDADGKKYLDLVAGIAVNALGHSHPKILQAIQHQSARLIHTSNLYHIQSQAELARVLCEASFADRAFFCNSGAEANEAAVKLARKYQKKQKGQDCFEIVTMERSFHGRTLAMIAATGQDKVKKGFEPLPSGFVHVAYDDVSALQAAVNEKTCAVMLEPVQGEGGVRFPAPDYLKKVREICERQGALLIYDEVQSGMGRTGKLFAYEHSGIHPDILTLAKSLATGLPIGACLASEKIAQAFEPGSHASTFGGNFLVCEVAKEFLRILQSEGVLKNAGEMGKYFKSALQDLQKKFPIIQQVRGEGLMLGVDLTLPAKPLVDEALQRGLLLNAAQPNTLRFVPPLTITSKEINEATIIMEGLLEGLSGGTK
jgi:acetylornithine and succinylornithine aminotransferases